LTNLLPKFGGLVFLEHGVDCGVRIEMERYSADVERVWLRRHRQCSCSGEEDLESRHCPL